MDSKLQETLQQLQKLNPNDLNQNTIQKLCKSLGINPKQLIKTMKKISNADKPKSEPKKIGRNRPCPCNSGKKYKKCCIFKNKKQKLVNKPLKLENETNYQKEICICGSEIIWTKCCGDETKI